MQFNILLLAFLVIRLGTALLELDTKTLYDDLLASPGRYGFKSWSRELDNQVRRLKNESIALHFNKCQNAVSVK
jgi:hypothetical protein